MRDQPQTETVDEDEGNSERLRDRCKPSEPGTSEDPLEFITGQLDTLNHQLLYEMKWLNTNAQSGSEERTNLLTVQANVIIEHLHPDSIERSGLPSLGNDARVIFQHQRQVDVTEIDNQELNSLKIVDASAKITTQNGQAIAILRQYALHGRGRTIHSDGQLEHYKNKVDDRSMKVGGQQCIRTLDGYVFPLDIINGLPYLQMVPNTDEEMRTLPHVILTAGNEWDPSVLDNMLTDQEDWYNMLKKDDDGIIKTPFDECGNYKNRHPPDNVQVLPSIQEESIDVMEADLRECFKIASNLNAIYACHEAETISATSSARESNKLPIDYKSLRPHFLHVSEEKIRETFKNTTQHATNVMSGHNIMQTM